MDQLKIEDRWSAGIPHERESIKLVQLIKQMDLRHFDDYFCLKIGGDGDNGETLMYIIDALIENKYIEVKFPRENVSGD